MSKHKKILKRLKKYEDRSKFVCDVHTAEAYFNLPKKERMNGIWYKTPMGMSVASFEDMMGGNSEFDKLDRGLKKEFPIQAFFRITIPDLWTDFLHLIKWMKIKDWWYINVECRIFPRHKELRNSIPKHWEDLVTIVPNFLFECIVDYVEREKAFEVIDWEESSEEHAQIKIDIQEIYNYVKNERPQLEKWWIETDDEKREQMEKELTEKDNKYLHRIIELRYSLWT